MTTKQRSFPGLTRDRLNQLTKDCIFGMANTGICKACGAEREGCEPDARRYPCYECGENEVYGVPEIFIMIGF